MMRFRFGIALLLLFVFTSLLVRGQEAASDKSGLQTHRKLILHGKYQKAKEALSSYLSDHRESREAAYHLARVRRLTGKYERGKEQIVSFLEKHGNGVEPRLRTELGWYNLILGKYKQGLEALNLVIDERDHALKAKWIKTRILRESGKYDQLQKIFRSAHSFSKTDKSSRLSPEKRYFLARIIWDYGIWSGKETLIRLVAETMMPSVLEEKEKFPEARTFLASCFAEKTQYQDAYEELKKVRKYNKQHPYTLVQLAQVTREGKQEKEAKKYIAAVARVNSHYFPLLKMRVKQSLIWRDRGTANKLIDRALNVNLHSPLFLSYRAVLRYIRGDMEAFRSFEKKVLSQNSKYGNLYFILGNVLTQRYRFQEAQKYFSRARSLNPNLSRTLREQGINFIRLANEKKGRRILERYYQRNSFDEKTVNVLNLLDDLLGDTFVTQTFPGYRVRMNRKEVDVGYPFVRALLKRVDQVMQERYDYQREDTILVELFQEHSRFSVRTMGMTGFMAHGVCFGKVTASLSPLARSQIKNFNWGSVLWHEMAHAYALRLSNHRVPRWFTEGLSTYEETLGYPGWERELEKRMFYAWKSDRLPTVQELDSGKRRSVFALYLFSSLIIEYIADQYGFDRIVKMLRAYGKDQQTGEVFQNVLDISLEDFQKQFMAYFRDRYEAYQLRDPISLKKSIGKMDFGNENPERSSIDRKVRRAIILYKKEKLDRAKKLLEQAREKGESGKLISRTLGDIAFQNRKWGNAVHHYEAGMREGLNDYQSYVRTGHSYEQLKKSDRAIAMYKKAIEVFPRSTESSHNPYIRLYHLYRNADQRQKAIHWLQKYVSMDHEEGRYHIRLASMYRENEQWKKMIDVLQSALYIDYWDLELHSYMGEGYEKLDRLQKAHRAYKSVVKILLQRIKDQGNDEGMSELGSLIAEHLYDAARMSQQMEKRKRAIQETRMAIKTTRKSSDRQEYQSFLESLQTDASDPN